MVRGWVTVYSVNFSSNVVRSQISSEVYAIFDSGQIEEKLVDIDRITSLRDPSVVGAATMKTPGLASTTKFIDDSGAERQSYANIWTPPDSNAVLTRTSSSSAQLEASTTVNDDTPFILRVPWWIWVCCLAGIIACWGLTVIIEKCLKPRDADNKGMTLKAAARDRAVK